MIGLIRGLANTDKPPQKGALLRSASAVFWSFSGIRRMRALDSDAASITPLQAIAAGLVGAALFVCLLLGVVRFAVS